MGAYCQVGRVGSTDGSDLPGHGGGDSGALIQVKSV